MMRQAKLCVVLLIFGLGWYGLPERGFAWDYTQSTNFGVRVPGDTVDFIVKPPKDGRGIDAIVTKGNCDDPGGYSWKGGLATWWSTITPDYPSSHSGRFSGEYGYPGTNGGRALTWQMNTAGQVVKVESLLPNNIEREIDDGDGNPDTRTFVVNMMTTAGDLVTVTATPTPNIAEANLPASWTLDGGNGSGKLVRTIDRTRASKTVLRCSCGNKKITTVYVVHCTYISSSDKNTSFGHAWWRLKIEPESAKVGVIEKITAGLSNLANTDGGFYGMQPEQYYEGPGWINIGPQSGYTVTAQHDWNITFQELMNGLNDLRSWVLDAGMYHWATRNCVYGSLRIGMDCGVTMPSYSYPNFFSPGQLHDWLNAQP